MTKCLNGPSGDRIEIENDKFLSSYYEYVFDLFVSSHNPLIKVLVAQKYELVSTEK